MNLKLLKFKVKNFRSLLDVEIEFSNHFPVVITGENNIGKTNFLRAMNIFFNHLENDLYDLNIDVPYHILYGSAGSGVKTELIGYFIDQNLSKNIDIKVIFSQKNGELLVEYHSCDDNSKKFKQITQEKFQEYTEEICLFFVESNNIHMPSLINTLLEKDGLLALDKKRKKQSEPLKKLQEFIHLSKLAIDDIQREINVAFKELTDFDGFLKDSEISINFVEFEKLRDIVKTMTSITLNDGNNHQIESKGSGAQRAVFLALMKYIAKNINNKNIIWAIDEPEVFLQPKLQRKVFSTLKDMCLEDNQSIIISTHSPNFINLSKPNTLNLFVGESSLKKYKRRPNKVFHEINTSVKKFNSDTYKIQAIKEHLGIQSNDGWELLPFNILVEGEEDKKYLEYIFMALDKNIPNIIWSGGASKIGGYLQYFNSFAKDNLFESKPLIICIFDNDNEGREQSNKVKKSIKSYNNIDIKILDLPRFDGLIHNETNKNQNWEIEDFLPPSIVFEFANKLLAKDKLKKITKAKQEDRDKIAHINKIILEYLSECAQHSNPNTTYEFNNQGRKKQLCQEICNLSNLEKIHDSLTSIHIDFIDKLIQHERR